VRPIYVCSLLFGSALAGWAATQNYYSGTNVTGQLVLVRTVDAMAKAQNMTLSSMRFRLNRPTPEFRPLVRLKPPLGALALPGMRALGASAASAALTYSLTVEPAANGGFEGLTHYDQRMANGENQFSVEPPNASIATGGGYVLQGVNNAVQVYTTAGVPLLPRVLTSNELFGLGPAIDRVTGVYGVYPTDMRVFYDHSLSRWFVLQRAQENDAAGNWLPKSRLFLAVSQTADPTRTYNIYEMNTTELGHPGCPCLLDFPQVGADQYGFYISGNQYSTATETFQDAAILAISKSSLLTQSVAPVAFRFVIPSSQGHEFSIQPATTPPGSSYFLANGGLEFFLSNNANYAFDDKFSVWAMYNTASLGTGNPNLFLTRLAVPGVSYTYPNTATQRPGPNPYGSSLFPPRGVPFIEGGDPRLMSLTYAGGRLYTAFSTRVTDSQGGIQVGVGYLVLSPTFRGGLLSAPVLKSGYLAANGNHLLRPAIAATARGQIVISSTLTGPGYYPSAVYAPFSLSTPPSVLKVAGAGALPEDGFTGYEGYPARWGDYSTSISLQDGSFWIAAEYIPNLPRTEYANWGTRVVRYVP